MLTCGLKQWLLEPRTRAFVKIDGLYYSFLVRKYPIFIGKVQSNGTQEWDFVRQARYSPSVHEFHLSAKIPEEIIGEKRKKKVTPKCYSQNSCQPLNDAVHEDVSSLQHAKGERGQGAGSLQHPHGPSVCPDKGGHPLFSPFSQPLEKLLGLGLFSLASFILLSRLRMIPPRCKSFILSTFLEVEFLAMAVTEDKIGCYY